MSQVIEFLLEFFFSFLLFDNVSTQWLSPHDLSHAWAAMYCAADKSE